MSTREVWSARNPPGLALLDPVYLQTSATGETYAYTFPETPQCPPASETTMTVSSAATTTVTMNRAGLPTAVTDPLGRTTTMTYEGKGNPLLEETLPISATRPEGDRRLYGYDGGIIERGNLSEERFVAKSGTGLPDIVRSASYPPDCPNRRTCNRPEFVVDANGSRTDFTYDPAHGGVLTETGPADSNGVRPQVRYAYQQLHAWIRNSSGGYSQAATPVWVLVSESRCRTSAATGNPSAPCATAGDEVVTSFDYGPDSGPNNLLLRGQVVSGGGLSARTCFGYDAQGNRISETGPGAQLTACP